jgi:hypothetical protein
MIERDVGAVVMADDRTCLGLFVYLDLHGRRLTNPLD